MLNIECFPQIDMQNAYTYKYEYIQCSIVIGNVFRKNCIFSVLIVRALMLPFVFQNKTHQPINSSKNQKRTVWVCLLFCTYLHPRKTSMDTPKITIVAKQSSSKPSGRVNLLNTCCWFPICSMYGITMNLSHSCRSSSCLVKKLRAAVKCGQI